MVDDNYDDEQINEQIEYEIAIKTVAQRLLAGYALSDMLGNLLAELPRESAAYKQIIRLEASAELMHELLAGRERAR